MTCKGGRPRISWATSERWRGVMLSMKCRVTIELQQHGEDSILMGNLTDISLGGCFIETTAILPAGTPLKLVFSIDDGKIHAEGSILRLEPGTGIGIQFNETTRGDRGKIPQVIEYVQKASQMYDNKYFEKLLGQKSV